MIKNTPQSESALGASQVKNNAGGYVFQLSKWNFLDRFLILGSESPTYYVNKSKLTLDNAKNLLECIKENGRAVVEKILDVSVNGRAPKIEPAIFALAMVTLHGDPSAKAAAYDAINKICKTGTQLFSFCQAIQDMRGWSRGLRRGVAKFYTDKPLQQVDLQLVKYRQRNGWDHKDVLRLSHPKVKNEELNERLAFAVGKRNNVPTSSLISAYVRASEMKNLEVSEETINELVLLIKTARLPRECVPTKFLNSTEVWGALLLDMPITALVRNLSKMGSLKMLSDNSEFTKFIVSKLTSEDIIRSSKVHPIAFLSAYNVYASGHGVNGSLTWEPSQQVLNALQLAFKLAFKNVTPTGQRYYIGLDVSGSMGSGEIAGVPGLSPRVGSTAMALITTSTESNVSVYGFSHEMIDLSTVFRSHSLSKIIDEISRLPFGGTDCALPMIHALKNNIYVDTFIIYTDSETWCGAVHPFQALKQYRKKINPNAKLVVVGMTATNFTIADPSDMGMLDVVGFDASTPALIADFSQQRLS